MKELIPQEKLEEAGLIVGRSAWGTNAVSIRKVAKIAETNPNVVLHRNFAFEIGNDEEVHLAVSDTEKIHLAYDVNGYIHGMNCKFLAMYDF